MADGKEVKNGKAFEYAIASEYFRYIASQNIAVQLENNEACSVAKSYFDNVSMEEQEKFLLAAAATIPTMVKIEPGLLAQKNKNDILTISIQKDQEGANGDVRDVIFVREKPHWEIGFSAKNNNDAVKHNRLSGKCDFGKKWLGIKCSHEYMDVVKCVFDQLKTLKKNNPKMEWEDFGNKKADMFYVPVLNAFRDEILRINENNDGVPAKLISYLVGNHPFYKVIKDDTHKMVVVKAFNINDGLNKTKNKVKPQYNLHSLNLPTRIVEFDYKDDSKDTLIMILDEGWTISFRIHSAKKKLEPSLKFDIQLLGNPTVLFTQHLFQ